MDGENWTEIDLDLKANDVTRTYKVAASEVSRFV
jgi:hypothetical protein